MNYNKTFIADEVIANLKMVGYAIIFSVVYMIGFCLYHYNDVDFLKVIGLESEQESNNYSNTASTTSAKYIMTEDGPKTFRQLEKENEESLRNAGLDPNQPLKYIPMPKLATSYDFPTEGVMQSGTFKASGGKDYIGKSIYDPEVSSIDDLNDTEFLSYYRAEAFKEDFVKYAKSCVIISILLFIFGRYIIKFGKWVIANKSC